MKKIDYREWKEYKLCGNDGIFDCYGSKTTPKKELEEKGTGLFPYVTTQATNNGIANYYDMYTEEGGVLSIDSAVLGTCFYQSKNFSASDHVEILSPKFKMTRNIALFLVTIINKNGKRLGYQYNLKRSQTELKQETIYLPSKVNGNKYVPDWEYMEHYVDKINSAVENKFNKIRNIKEEKNIINTKKWMEFKVGDLFILDKPKPRSKSKYEKGKMPFVASGNYNNGVECYVKPKDNKDFDKGNCLTVSPVDGCTFYQFNDFLGRGGAGSSIIILRNSNLNKLNGLFLSTIINKQLSKFNYSNMGNQTIIKSEIISLPADSHGNPDWAYMEEYITNIENKAHKKIKCLSQCCDDVL